MRFCVTLRHRRTRKHEDTHDGLELIKTQNSGSKEFFGFYIISIFSAFPSVFIKYAGLSDLNNSLASNHIDFDSIRFLKKKGNKNRSIREAKLK